MLAGMKVSWYRQYLFGNWASCTPRAGGQLSSPLRDWVQRALKPPGMSLAPLDSDIAAESTLLPGVPQGDPADRFLVATARIRDVILATRDRKVIEYGKAGHVRVLKL